MTNDQALRRNLNRMLNSYATDQASAQHQAHRAAGRAHATFRYSPTPFHNVAVGILGRGSAEDVAATIHRPELAGYLGVTTGATAVDGRHWVALDAAGDYVLTADRTSIATFPTADAARQTSGRPVRTGCLTCGKHADEFHSCDCGAS
jgi:hypothetical protein